MDRIATHLALVSPTEILTVSAVVLVCVAIVPRYFRLALAIAFAAFWLSLNIFSELPVLASLAKTTYVIAPASVIVASLLHPGPRQRVAPIAILYIVLGLVGFIYLVSTVDRSWAFSLQIGRLLIGIAAYCTARVITDEDSLLYVLRSLGLGLTVILFICLNALFFDPASFGRVLGRFFPYGANPNQIGVVFIQIIAICPYLGVRSRNYIGKVMWYTVTFIAVALGLTTGSRSVVLILAIFLVFHLHVKGRSLVAMIALAVFGFAITTWVLSSSEYIMFGRLENLDTARYRLAYEYLQVIAKRPFTGLLGTSGQSAHAAPGIGTHSHNAYLQQLYTGGISYAGPYFLLILATLWSASSCWSRRKVMRIDPKLLRLLIVLMCYIYFHGLVNELIYYPTNIWSFTHILLSVFILTLANQIKSPTSSWLVGVAGQESKMPLRRIRALA